MKSIKQYSIWIIIGLFILISCNHSGYGINDKSKRNANWEWWVDNSTRRGEWIPLVSDSSTLKNGSYTNFYYNGVKCEEGKLLNGKKVDTMFAYDLNGELDCYVIAGIDSTIYLYKNGYRKVYSREGNLMAESQVKNHKFYGILVNYFKNRQIKFRRNYVRDSGWNVNYYENGNIKDSAIEFNNSGNGLICTSWFENGQIKSIVGWNRKTGKQEGNTKRFYEKNDKFESDTESSVNWENGLYDGITLLYHRNGKLSDSLNYINGKREGVGKSWDENGKLILIDIYKDDIVLKSENFSTN